ncbi:hypothetical protein BH11PSE13_BH11PSE13_10950 [soil metagenome]
MQLAMCDAVNSAAMDMQQSAARGKNHVAKFSVIIQIQFAVTTIQDAKLLCGLALTV